MIHLIKPFLGGLPSSLKIQLPSRFLLAAAAVGLAGPAALSIAPAAQAEWLPVLSRSCSPKGNGIYICTFPKDGKVPGPQAYRSYEGTVKVLGNRRWLPHGYGVLVYEDDQRYEGQMVNGIAAGQGMYLFANNDRYEGGIKEAQPHGLGKMFFAETQGTYEGQYYLGQIKGSGTYSTPSMVCQGQFFSSKLSGEGTCNYRGNSPMMTYTGEWRGGIPEGRGTMIYSNGRRFSGEWRQGKEFVPGVTKK